jgi:hypothetical protein
VTPVYKLSASSVTGRTNYGSMLAGNPVFVETDFQSIATVSVGSGGVSSVTFSSIPLTYKHLQLRILTRASDSAVMAGPIFRVNGDSGANYSYHLLTGNGATVGSSGFANAGFMHFENIIANTAGANNFGVYIIDFLDYADTNKYKTAKALQGWDNNGVGSTTGQAGFHSANWRSTSAINQIVATMFTGSNFMEYSSFALYGIKGA